LKKPRETLTFTVGVIAVSELVPFATFGFGGEK
jgi:hypothetical protein